MSGLRHNITRLREERGVTRAHLSRQIGVSRAYITRLEKGDLQPSGKVMLRVARYFNRPVEDVFQLEAGGSVLQGRLSRVAASESTPSSAGHADRSL